MTIRGRNIFFLVVAVLFLLLLFIEKEILTPFIVAAIFAYILNPIVNFLSNKARIPRSLSVILIYVVIVSIIGFGSIIITRQIIYEYNQLTHFIDKANASISEQVNTLPNWLQPTVNDALKSVKQSKIFSSQSLLVLFPAAISSIFSFIIFAFAGFYFLKEGGNMIDTFTLFIPAKYKQEIEILIQKINAVLGDYLRGQLLLVFLMTLALFILFTVLGIRFALILAIFSGITEIVPYLGPVLATGVGALVVLTTGVSNFALPPITVALIVVAIYFILRQIQDYFVSPLVMGKITKLHPLIILFSVLSGGYLGGTLGLIIAIPIAAIIRILLKFSLDKLNEQDTGQTLPLKKNR